MTRDYSGLSLKSLQAELALNAILFARVLAEEDSIKQKRAGIENELRSILAAIDKLKGSRSKK